MTVARVRTNRAIEIGVVRNSTLPDLIAAQMASGFGVASTSDQVVPS